MNQLNIKQVVLWGHKLHSSKHSYIHYGFYKAFKSLGYDTLWLDDNDTNNIYFLSLDFENTLFITEGNVDMKIPIVEGSHYILFECDLSKYRFKDINILILKTYSKDCLFRPYLKKIDRYIFYEYISFYNEFSTIYMPWATDLLPDEIEENMKNIDVVLDNNTDEINFIGSLTQEIFCARFWFIINGYKFNEYGSPKKVSFKENEELIKKSYIALSLQSETQINKQYITSRIFKNISYGKMGITNNQIVAEVFDGNIIYNSDIQKVLELGIEFEKSDKEIKKARILFLMDYVKQKHTYINRIKSLFKCLTLISS